MNISHDCINGIFEFCGGLLTLLSVIRLHRERRVRGVHIAPIVFFTAWGLWNLFYYPHLDQWVSFAGGVFLVLVNMVWVIQMIMYRKN